MTRQLSQAHQDQEEKNRQAEIETQAKEKEANTNVYWTRASKCQIGNFVKEIKQAGQIVQPEASLTIYGNTLATDDPEKIKFLEGCDAFRKGTIIKCKDLADAHARTAALRAEKSVKEYNNEDVSFTDLTG